MNKEKVLAALEAATQVAATQVTIIDSAIAYNLRLAEELEILATKDTLPLPQPGVEPAAPVEDEDDDTDDKLLALAAGLRENNDRMIAAFKINTPEEKAEGPQPGDGVEGGTTADPVPASDDPAHDGPAVDSTIVVPVDGAMTAEGALQSEQAKADAEAARLREAAGL